MANYTLGLDIGSKSIGWALLNTDKKPSIEALGVRVFPEGVDRDTKGLEVSKSAVRRDARGARRMHQRRNLRRSQILKTLQSKGFMPKNKSEQKKLFKKDPYQLRKKGLDEKLELHEFGRALFHLNQRRGFKSNRKSGKAKEDGAVIKEATALQKNIEQKNCRTLGEYFASLNPEEQRIRDWYTFRKMYEDEFDLLWTRQKQYYPELLTEELNNRIRNEIIFFQRPMKWDEEAIGNCELEPGEKRCPRGDWFARRFRLLQDVNNLLIYNPDGTKNKFTEEQRKTVLEALSQKDKLEFDKIREKLNLLETQQFNLEQGGKVKTLKGDVFTAEMRSKKLFGSDRWNNMPEEEKIALNNACLEMEDEKLARFLRDKYSFNDEQIEKVFKISLPDKYMSFSRKAIIKMLPFMEQGDLTHQAKAKAYPVVNTINDLNTQDKLPMPSDLRNPLVNKAISEVRNVVNTIVREFGKPERIVIEMARDVRGSKKEREEQHFKMLENEKINEAARKKLVEDMNIAKPTWDDILKYKLWAECGKICPYTGKPISQSALFGQNPEFQIEHILPYSRSLDDSFMNKTLCGVHENKTVKRNQTPYEAYSNDQQKYETIKQRIAILPYPKRKKFTQKELELDEHIKRELNDTRYICREAVSYLQRLSVIVKGTRGKITSELRHQWGLNGIFTELGVERGDDHRRHAVDAVIVAVTKNEHLHKLAASKYAVVGTDFPQPWPDFREEVREKVKHINVSHRANKKVSGQLHEETSYGITGKKDKKGQDIYVYRKELKALTIPMVANIVDPVVKDIVKNRLAEKGINPDAKGERKIPKEVWNEPLYMKTTKSSKKVPIKKVRIEDVKNNVKLLNDENGKPYRAVEPGNNHHIEIFEYKDKKGHTKREGKVVAMFDAVQRSQKGLPVVQRDYGDGKRFFCSLTKGEMFMLELNDGKSFLCRVQEIWESTNIVLRPHSNIAENSDINKTASRLTGHKVTVDPIGRIWPAND